MRPAGVDLVLYRGFTTLTEIPEENIDQEVFLSAVRGVEKKQPRVGHVYVSGFGIYAAYPEQLFTQDGYSTRAVKTNGEGKGR